MGVDGALNAVPPAVDHGHNVGEVQTLHHHVHEFFITAGTSHKLLQGELTCWEETEYMQPSEERSGEVSFV